MGLLRERDQTIVTLETEVSEVTNKKPTNIRCLCGSQLQLMLDFDSSLILKSVNSQLWAGDLQTEPATEREGPTSSKWVGGSDHTTCQMYKCQNQEKTQELDSSQKHTEIECICRCTSRTSQTCTLSWRRWRRPWIGERSFLGRLILDYEEVVMGSGNKNEENTSL